MYFGNLDLKKQRNLRVVEYFKYLSSQFPIYLVVSSLNKLNPIYSKSYENVRAPCLSK